MIWKMSLDERSDKQMIVETTTYLLEASLRKGETVTDTMDWPFQVLANSPIEAADILREYLLHPERTGIRYKECVGIIPIESRTVLTNRISRDIPQQVKQVSLSGRSVCPVCKKLMAINVKRFCDNCGQAIKWG